MKYLEDPDVTLYHGDCLEVLRTLPDRSVHMCATSPPFYGLRDYGTGTWEGGDEGCDHVSGKDRNDSGTRHSPGGGPFPGSTEVQFRVECAKCGARRIDRQIGLEESPDEWVARLVEVFGEVKRVLRDDGTLWIELGDSFANKQLVGQPWQLAFALQRAGWFLRSEIIWARLHPNPMPESVTDRPTKAHSTVFLLSKCPRYFYDQEAIREAVTENPGGAAFYARKGATMPTTADSRKELAGRGDGDGSAGWANRVPDYAGANARSVWQIATEPTPFAHFATWPQKLCRRMIQAGCPEGGTVLDPFGGSGTTALVARKLGRKAILIELNEEYCELVSSRLAQQSLFAVADD